MLSQLASSNAVEAIAVMSNVPNAFLWLSMTRSSWSSIQGARRHAEVSNSPSIDPAGASRQTRLPELRDARETRLPPRSASA
jgi:hypothetical protein